MATAVQSPLASSPEKTISNGAKLSRLLIDGGKTAVGKKIFDHYHSQSIANLASDLKPNYIILNNLSCKRVLNGHQWAIAEITIKELHQKQLELRKALQDKNSKLEELSNTLRKTQYVTDKAVKMEPKGHQEMTAAHVHQKSMSYLEGLIIKSQSKTQQEIHEIRESVQQVKHEVKTLKKGRMSRQMR